MDFTRRGVAFMVATCLVVCLLTARFVSVNRDYPYYFMWDMGLTTTVDSILLQSGYLPDHINHPGFGMYLLLGFSETIARAQDAISVRTLEDLSGSLNPIVGAAELTDFIRMHSPFLAIGLVLSLWAALCLMFRPSRLVAFLVLLAIGTQESLVFHSALIRTEFYGLFFWSGAVLLLALALRAAPGAAAAWLFGAGILLGLCYLTKLQTLFCVAVFPVLLLFGLASISSDPLRPTDTPAARRRALAATAVGVINALAFPLLLVAASGTSLPPGMGVFQYTPGQLNLAPYAVLLLVVLLAVAATQLFLLLGARASTSLFGFLRLASWLALGFQGSFLLHLLALPDLGQSLSYLLYDFKMLFFRGTYHELHGLLEYLRTAWALFLYNPSILTAHLAVLGALVLGHVRGWTPLPGGQLVLLFALTGFALLQLAFGTRWVLRDLVFVEVLVNVLTLMYALLLLQRAARAHRALRAVAAGALLLLLATNVVRSDSILARLDANFNRYGWWEERWFESVYRGQQLRYRLAMSQRYRDRSGRDLGRLLARDHREIRRTVAFVFKNQTVTHRNIGVLAHGFPVWTSEPSWRIERAPDRLEGAILVDNASLPVRRHYAFDAPTVRSVNEDMDKLREAPPRHIVALSRRDLEIFLFAERDDLARVGRSDLRLESSRLVTLTRAGKRLDLYGVRLLNYEEIPLDRFEKRFFFVIRRS